MRNIPWILAVLFLLAAVLAAPAEDEDFWGENEASTDSLSGEPADSLLGEPADSLHGLPPGEPITIPASRGVHPRFRSDTRSTDRRIDVNNTMTLGMSFANNWTLSSNIFYKRGIPRGLKRETTEKGFSVSTNKRFLGRFPMSLSVDRNRFRQDQNRGESNYRRDDREKTGVSANATAGWALTDWLGVNGLVVAGVQTNETKNNQGLHKLIENGNRNFAGRVDLKPVDGLKIVAGYSGGRSSGTGALLDLTGQLQSTNDSIQVKLDFKPDAAFTLSISGGELEQSSEMLDFQRDIFNVVLPESIPVKERTVHRNWGGRLSMDWKPVDKIALKVSLSAMSGQKRASTSITKDRDDDSQDLDVKLTLKPWSTQSTDVGYRESNKRIDEYTSDKKNSRREAFLRSTQRLGQEFQLIVDLNLLLSQDFYANPENNPLDRDQIKDRYSLIVKGRVFPWLNTSNTFAYYKGRDIMILSSKSISNKDKTTLSWSSKLDYNFFGRFLVNQRLEVQVSKDDFVFTQEQNSLDRESTLQTKASFPIYRKIKLDIGHEFKLRQMGSFLPDPSVPGHPETFFLSKRVKKEKLTLGISYTFFQYLSFNVREELGREVTYYYSDGSQNLTPYGNMDLGLVYNRKLGEGGKVRIELQHKARSGRFVRENQRSIWIPTLAIEYNF